MNVHTAYVAGSSYAPMGQHPEEIIPFLAWIAAGQPKVIAEIGVWHGALSRAFCDIASDRVIGIDWPAGDGGIDHEAAVRRDERLQRDTRGKYVGILGESLAQGTVDAVKRLCGQHGWIDVLFIDGDHRGDAPERDYDAYLPLVRTGGIIAFHDIDAAVHPGVRTIYEKLRMRHPASVTFSGGHTWGGIGVLVV